ncbi:MAG: hypothetical protein IJK67_02670 [Bacilli bacterium]|nr:hypothetical protein [Bacilli bacterium]
MFNKKIEDFFKKHNLWNKEMFSYIYSISNEVDYYDKNINFAVGCPPKVNNHTGKIEGFQLTIPYCVDGITTMIAVHEIAHAIYWYKKIGQTYDEIQEELFPMIVERLYVEENKTSTLESYEKFLDSTIDSKEDSSYSFALVNRESFMKTNLDDFKLFDKSARKLARKWRRKNR